MDREIRARLESWLDEHFDALVEDLKRLAAIPSVSTYDDPDTPFGPECKRVLEEMLALAGGYGFQTQNCEDRCGTMTRRPGDAEIAVWCHLDVVPAGDGWSLTRPFEPVVRDGYLIGRGVDDNKGPAVGALYVLRAFEELGIPTRHGLRLCVGCDEEHGMADVMYYAANYPPAALAIVADAGFPVGYGEKGIIEANIVSDRPMETILSLRAGMASNIVPDAAETTLRGAGGDAAADERVAVTSGAGETRLVASGVSCHSARPGDGVNAIHSLTAAALRSGLLSDVDAAVMGFFTRVNDDWLGTALGIAGSDDISGETTCAGTMLSLREDGRAVLHVNIRHCIGADAQQLLAAMERACRENGCALEPVQVNGPNYFPRENPVVDALTGVYNEMTGADAQPYVMAGGTYARKLPNALVYGMGGLPREETDLFGPGRGGAHQRDEGLHLASLKRALLIFAMGLLAADAAL